ncbi:MAG: hypothetical protein ACXVQV_07880, partial [Actinomycetota bacterium]
MEQPVPTTDAKELQADVEEVEAATDESPAVQRAEDEVNDEPTSTADELSERAGGPDLAEEVPAVVEGEVIEETEEATFESEEPDVPGATGAADPGSDIPTEPVAEEAEQPLVASEDAAA